MSLKTVSRVVNDEEGVSDDVRSRVLSAVDELGYRRDERARSLKSGPRSTRSIGLVTVDAANPFQAELHRSLEDGATERGYFLLSGSSDESVARERELVELFQERRVEGLVVVAAGESQSYLEREIQRGTPVVLVDRAPSQLDCDYVTTDNIGGARLAVKQMISHGHKRIAFIGDDPAIWTARSRHEGYLHEMESAGLPVDPALVATGVRGKEAAQSAAGQMLMFEAPPTAFFSAQNLITVGVVRALHEASLHEEVALIGFDDIEFADLVTPGITVIAQDPREIGQVAMGRLFARLSGTAVAPEGVLLPPRLVARGSGEIHA